MSIKRIPKIIFFDFKISEKDWVVSFKYCSKEIWKDIHNNRESLINFLESESDSLFVSFGKTNTYLISAILANKSPYSVQGQLILNGGKVWDTGLKTPNITIIDLSIENKHNLTLTFDEVKGNLGYSLKKPEVLTRELNDVEAIYYGRYNHYDVRIIEELFIKRKEWMQAKLNLLKMKNWSMKMLNKTNPQLTAFALGAELTNHKENEFVIPDNLSIGNYINPEEIVEDLKNGGSPTLNLRDLNCKLGSGGLHGAIPKFISDNRKKYVFIDASLYYPTIMLKNNYLSRSVKDKKVFEDIYIQRQQCLPEQQELSQTLKQILVSTYGAMERETNPLHDPSNRLNIAIAGQMYLLDLINKVEPFARIIQINTDGILVEYDSTPLTKGKIKNAVMEWEQRTGFFTTWEGIKKIYQKDVNNYLSINESGEVKVKGAYLKQSDDNWDGYSRSNMRVIDLALREFLVNGTRINDFIRNHKNLKDFQILVKLVKRNQREVIVSRNNNRTLWSSNTSVRTFATNDMSKGNLFKLSRNKLTPIFNIPEYNFVYNGEMKDLKFEQVGLNYDYYIEKAFIRLRDFGFERLI